LSCGWIPNYPSYQETTPTVSFCRDVIWFKVVINKIGTHAERGINIIEREQTLESSLERCFENVGISLLCDWDIFVFLHRHIFSLTSADQIARLVGYESDVVGEALDRLENQKLIERSRTSRGVRLYRVLTPKDVEHRGWLCKLVTLSENRAGRLELTKCLRLGPMRYEKTLGVAPRSEGKGNV
jgi:DNA-binding transcriptional ArsR family regulator